MSISIQDIERVESQILADINHYYLKIQNNEPTEEYYHLIIKQYEKLEQMKNENVTRRKNVEKTDDSFYMMQQNYLDTTMYIQILWIVLAISLIYFLFSSL